MLRLDEPLADPVRPGTAGVVKEVRREDIGGGSDAPELLRDMGTGGAGASSGTGGIDVDGVWATSELPERPGRLSRLKAGMSTQRRRKVKELDQIIR